MKKSLLLGLAFGIALSACSKKKIALPLGSLEENKQSSNGRPADAPPAPAWTLEKPLNGVWQTPCVVEKKIIQISEHTKEQYDSYRALVVVDESSVYVEFLRFKGQTCGRIDLAVQMGESEHWTYQVLEQGDRSGHAYFVRLMNSESGDESEDYMVLTGVDKDLASDTLQLGLSGEKLTRRSPDEK